jgi:hypothetical protein
MLSKGRLSLIAIFCFITILNVPISKAALVEIQADQPVSNINNCASRVSVDSPVRAGTLAYKHEVKNCGERSEFEKKDTEIGGTYWYGFSYFFPTDERLFPSNNWTIVAQFGAYPSVNPHPCGGIGSKISAGRDGKMQMDFQRSNGSGGSTCTKHDLANMDDLRGKWNDIVMHVKWTGNNDGFLKLWIRHGGGEWIQKINHTGRTFWNNEGTGPYFKMGIYLGSSGRGDRLLYTDEYRLGDSNSSFDEVAPGGSGGGGGSTPTPTPIVTPTPTPTPIDGCYVASGGSSWLNNAFTNQTGTFTATFDAKPSVSPSNMHVALSDGARTGYTGYAAIIRFNASGNIDARNGSAYAAASTVPYSANTNYKFRVVVNIPAHTYSVYVTPAGGSEVVVGENFAFRTEQATVSQLNNWGAFTDASSGSLNVCNFKVGQPTTTLIDEDCSSLANFTPVSGGTWGSNNGQCTLTAAATTCSGPLCNILTHNTSVSGDYTLTAEASAVASSNAWDDFAIVFGYVDASNYYYASFNEGDDAGTNGIFRVQAGAKTQVVDFGSNVTAPGSSLYGLKLVKTGSTIKAYKGSSLIGTLSGAGFSSGKVGFASFNNNATFDNLKVVKN